MKNKSNYGDAIGVALLVLLAIWAISRLRGPAGDAALAGTPMPPLTVAGWLNLREGETFDPQGKIVVVDLWATWCAPCRAEMPRLAEVVKRYRPLGVAFVGLTSETKRDVPLIEEFIAQTPGFDWPVGFGAIDFFDAMNVQGIPTLLVFGADGRLRWSTVGAGQPGLEEALDAALAAMKTQPTAATE